MKRLRLFLVLLLSISIIVSLSIPMYFPKQVLAAPTYTTHITGGFDAGNHSAGYYYGLSGGNQGIYNGTDWFIHSSCFPMDGTLKNLRIEQTGTLGANRTYTITISGVATALAATVIAGSLTAENLTYSLAVSQNDLLSMQVGAASLTVGGRWYMDFEATGGTDYFSLILGNSYTPEWIGTNFYHTLTNQSPSENDNETMSYCLAPVDGTISDLYAYQHVGFGVGRWWSMTLRQNGIDTALTVSLTGHLHYTSSAAVVTVSKGDRLDWRIENGGADAGHGILSYGAIFTPAAQDKERAVWMYGSNDPLSATTSENNSFLPWQNSFTWGGLRDIIVQGGGLRATNLYVRLSAAPGAAASGKQYTFTLYVNSVATALTCTILNDATYAEDTTTSVSLANGDNLSINCTPLNSPDVVFATWGVVIKEEAQVIPALTLSCPVGLPLSYENITTGANGDSETIGDDDWSFQSVLATGNHTINLVSILIYRVGSPTTLHVYLYDENPGTFFPDVLLSEGETDVSAITENITGEWVNIGLDDDVPLIAGQYYDIVLYQEAAGANDVVWNTTTTDGAGDYGHSHDGGTTWAYDTEHYRDGLFQLWYCFRLTSPDALHIIALESTSITLAWQESSGLPTFQLLYKLTDYPINETDGTIVYFDNITSCKVDGLSPGITYYFGVWTYSGGLYSISGAYCTATTSAGHGLPAAGIDAGGEEDATILQGSPVGGLINFVSAYTAMPIGTTGLMGFGSILLFVLVAVACYNRSVIVVVICALAGLALGRELGVFSTVLLVVALIVGAGIGYLRGGQPTGG